MLSVINHNFIQFSRWLRLDFVVVKKSDVLKVLTTIRSQNSRGFLRKEDPCEDLGL